MSINNELICFCGGTFIVLKDCKVERAGKIYRAYQCDLCGTKIIFPKENQTYYDKKYINNKKSIETIYNDQKRMLSLWDSYVTEIKSHPFVEKSVIDLGAYTGYILYKLSQDGWVVDGVEINPAFVKYAAQFYKIVLRQSSIFSIEELSKKAWGLSLCTEVLDHFVDPFSVLDIMQCISKNSYITVRGSELFYKYDYFTHLWYFTEKGIRTLLEKYCPQELIINKVETEFGSELRLLIQW